MKKKNKSNFYKTNRKSLKKQIKKINKKEKK